MRDPDRIEPLLQLIQRAWAITPDLRLGQLVTNAASFGGWTNRNDVFSVEDTVVEKGLHRMLEEYERKTRVNRQEPR